MEPSYYHRIDERHLEYAFLYTNLEGTRFLDVGCGDCTISLALYKLGFDAHAINLMPYKFKFDNFKKGNFLKADYEDDYFDTVACISVLEHLNQKSSSEMIAKMHKILKPGGVLIASFPTAGEWTGCTKIDPVGNFPGFNTEKIRYFDRKNFTAWIEYDPKTTDSSTLERAIALVKVRKI